MKNVQFVVGKVVMDGHVITGQSLGTAYEFAFKILEATGYDVEELKNKLMHQYNIYLMHEMFFCLK